MVADNSFGNPCCNTVLVATRVDDACFSRVTHEAAFNEYGWVANASEDAVASTLDASVRDTRGACAFKCAAMDSGSQCDVRRVLVIPLAHAVVRAFYAASVVCHANWGKGKGLDASRLAAATSIEVDGDEDGVFVAVGEVDSLLEREIAIAIAGHNDIVALALENTAHETSDFEVVVGLSAILIHRSSVFTAMAGVENDGAEISATANVGRAQDGVDEF